MPDSPTYLHLDTADTIGVSRRPLRTGDTVVWIDAGRTVMNKEFVSRQIGAGF